MDLPDLILEPKLLEWANISDNCNTNNHAIIDLDEYHRLINLTNKDNWVKLFPDPPNSLTIKLSFMQLKMLYDATKIGVILLKRPSLYYGELKEIENYIKNEISNYANFNINDTNKWFIRLSNASPKDGIHSVGPLLSIEQMVDSIVTSKRILSVLERKIIEKSEDNLYIVPWRDDWNENMEFRVFVHDKKITAISQYIWKKYIGFTDIEIIEICRQIIIYCYTEIIPKAVSLIDNFIIDVIYNINKCNSIPVELIELNSFGKNLATGSALFHWINDDEILCKKYESVENSKVYVRYII